MVVHETHEPSYDIEDELSSNERYSGEEEEEEEAETESYTVVSSEEHINYWHFKSIFQFLGSKEIV